MSSELAAVSSVDSAFERAYQEQWHDVFRFALAWTNEPAAAEDLAQESFVRLWAARTTVDWDRPTRGWLLVTTRRLATDRFRALRRRISGSQGSEVLDTHALDRWLDVQAAMACLSTRERTALVLTALEGYSYSDAADVLGTSPGAVRAAVSRGREKLEGA